jgi:signal transduction histidine kinase
MRSWFSVRSNGQSLLGPVLLLVLIVALPTAAVLWLMTEATQNERLAVRQHLADVYRNQLEMVRQRVVADWRQSLAQLDTLVENRTPAQAFAACVRGRFVDSVIVLDANGKPAYPADDLSTSGDAVEDNPAWREAQRLEFVDRDYPTAAQAYDRIARETTDDNLAGRAVQSQVRSLLSANQTAAAVAILQHQVESPRLQQAVSPDGRWLLADLMLLLAATARDSDPPLALQTATALAKKLEDYDQPLITAAQRRFIMHELRRIFSDQAPLPTLPAEDLAAETWERTNVIILPRELQTAGAADLWQVVSPNNRVLALLHTATLVEHLKRSLASQTIPPGVHIAPVQPQDAGITSHEFLSLAIGPELPQWRLSLVLTDDPFDGAASNKGRFYFWTALVTIVATSALALLVAVALRRQNQLARLKNDLVATVSHELKTPLSSIRLFVDTLLEQDSPEPQQTREYLQLVARENQRLSRLIDNFLTFSRLDRGKQQFTLAPIQPADIARRAVEALHERLHEPDCQFDLHIEPGLPAISADADALVTVLVNLLDNACKYSGPTKRIALRVFSSDHRVCFAVADDGVGLSPRHQRRVFDRFYQVDQQLTRSVGGCGLGLSIVRSIVAAHGGSTVVESKLGRGSTFTVSLPATISINHLEGPCKTS